MSGRAAAFFTGIKRVSLLSFRLLLPIYLSESRLIENDDQQTRELALIFLSAGEVATHPYVSVIRILLLPSEFSRLNLLKCLYTDFYVNWFGDN